MSKYSVAFTLEQQQRGIQMHLISFYKQHIGALDYTRMQKIEMVMFTMKAGM